MEVVNHQFPSKPEVIQPGGQLAGASLIFANISAVLGASGIVIGLGSTELSGPYIAFVLMVFFSGVCGFTGFSLGAMAMARSKGRRGILGFIISIAVVAVVVVVRRFVPTRPFLMGNIH